PRPHQGRKAEPHGPLPPPVSLAGHRAQGPLESGVTRPTAAGHERSAVRRPRHPWPHGGVHRAARLGGRLTPAKDIRLSRAGTFSGTVPHGVLSPPRGGAAR